MSDNTDETIDVPNDPDAVTGDLLRDAYTSRVPDRYRNFGDANPEAHGGIWVQWDFDQWHVVRTQPLAELDDREFHEGEQLVRQGYVQWDRVITDAGEWTDDMRSDLETYVSYHDEPAGAVIDGSLTGDVGHFAHGLRFEFDRYETVSEKASYAAVLDSFGVNPR